MEPNFRAPNSSHIERTNSFGFRDIDRTLEQVPGKKRMVLLGDSIVVGHGLAKTQDTIGQNMERLLDSVEVVNVGVGGFNSLGEAELLKTKGLQFDPDLVCLIFVRNDFNAFNSQIWKYPMYKRPKVIEDLFIYSHAFRVTALRMNLFNFEEQVDPENYRIRHNRNAMGLGSVVDHGFRVLAELQAQRGFQLIIVGWPRFGANRISDDQYLNRVNPIAKRYGLKMVRLAPYFVADYKKRGGDPNAARNLKSPNLFYTVGDEMHPNKKGAAVAAKAIIEALRLNTDFL